MTPTDILAANGPLAGLVQAYAPRPQQIEMAEAIDAALQNGESLICEAGTGTGKTFAYLVPAILSGRKVIVSTGTRHLQDQLHGRDLPLVRDAIRRPVNVALLKGRTNYLCLQRMHDADNGSPDLDRKSLALLADVRLWSQQTDSGDLAELADMPEESPLRPAVTSTTENCLGQSCAHFDDCFVYRARRRAQEADITIVNHHLYLADLALREEGRGELLPPAEIVIFDEAHQLPHLASEFFSRTASSHQWFDLLRDCRAAYVQEAGDVPAFLQGVDRVEKAVRDLRLAFAAGEGAVAWHEAKEKPEAGSALRALLDSAHDLHDMLEALAERGKLLAHCQRRLSDLLTITAEFHEPSAGPHVQWLELRGRGFALHQTPLDIAQEFQSRLADSGCQCIYTSATLSVNGDFRHFASQLGLGGVAARRWPSPFDFQSQVLLYVPEELPDPRQNGYTELAMERALAVLEMTRGRAFVLFTSYRALNIAAPLIRSRVAFPVLVQGDAPRTELLETFRGSGEAVLLGTASFWEGVDVRGQALSCVIIDKLPFAAPDDPVLQARLRKMEEEHRNPFTEYQLPEAIIDLLQGIGRLIRDSDDYGVLMICDPRLLSKPYGKTFLRSLPRMRLTRDPADIGAFMQAHESGKWKVESERTGE
ncbi:MAG: ATP-dependent DNA helicase [Gammaproteobacteria bacterium]|nr:ATP-dependent DNA helicase [Gammaproteobacteria bacterium]